MRFYFAYGSNMLAERLRERVPSARALGAGRLSGYRLAIDKRGGDGSAKCNIHPGAADDSVFGVVYSLEPAERVHLDRAEGPGYAVETVEVEHGGGARAVFTYRAEASACVEDWLPYDWYLRFVIAGAQQHGLPLDYRTWLARQPCRADIDAVRWRRNQDLLTRAAPW